MEVSNIMTNEQKANIFLNYIANNLPMLKKSLKKNITYDEDIFDDVISESIIKIYNTISKNGTDVTDYEKYFFIVAKFTYIYHDNKKKRNEGIEVRDLFGNKEFDIIDEIEDSEERYNSTLELIESIKSNLIKKFGETKVNIFMEYMSDKNNGRTSYKKISNEYRISVREVSSIINEIKNYISESDDIIKIKKRYKES